MRSLLLCCAVLALAGPARAQAQAVDEGQASGVAVEKHSWSKERIGWERDPFGGPVEGFEEMRRRRVDERRVARARTGGNPGEADRIEREMRAEQVLKARPTTPPRYAFLYKISVRNTGQKAVKEFDWDYVFYDAATGQELGRREFTGIEKIAPGKHKELSFYAPTPPVHRISVHSLDRKERESLRGEAVIVRVLYADGTVWQPPAPPPAPAPAAP